MFYPWLNNAIFVRDNAIKKTFEDDVNALQRQFSKTVIDTLRKLETVEPMLKLDSIIGTSDVSDTELDTLVLSIYHLENESDILDDYSGDGTEYLESLLKSSTRFDIIGLVGSNMEAVELVERIHSLYRLIRSFVDSTHVAAYYGDDESGDVPSNDCEEYIRKMIDVTVQQLEKL